MTGITDRNRPGRSVRTPLGTLTYREWCDREVTRLNKSNPYRVDTDHKGDIAIVIDVPETKDKE